MDPRSKVRISKDGVESGSRLPRLLMLSNTLRPPLDCWRGTSPSQALSSRPLRNWRVADCGKQRAGGQGTGSVATSKTKTEDAAAKAAFYRPI
jgi:hypothetical protein